MSAPAWGCAGLVVALAVGCAPAAGQPATPPRAAVTVDPVVNRQVVLGYSVQRRPIVARELGDPDGVRRVLVVGCIHGNEPAGAAITRALLGMTVPPDVDLWVVPSLNPDGVLPGTRGNAHGVDLNRNLPFRWRVLGPPGSTYYSGPHALSEPEARAARGLLLRLRPSLAVWYHQHLDVVDDSEGPVMLLRRYATDTGMRLARLVDEPGSATGYENHLRPQTAFVVELPAGRLSSAAALRHARAVLDLASHS